MRAVSLLALRSDSILGALKAKNMNFSEHYSDFCSLINEVISQKNSPQMTCVLNPRDTILLKNTQFFGLREDSVSGLLTARPRVGIVVLLPSLPSLYH